MDRTIEKLKHLSTITPREDWVQRNKELLLAQISAQTPDTKESVWHYWYLLKLALPVRLLQFVARPVGAVAVMLLVIVSSGILTVGAAKSSLPGDLLYSVKLTSERVRVGLTIGDDNKAKAHIALAEERVHEIETIVKQNLPDQPKRIKEAADGLKKELESVNEKLESIKTTKVEKDQATASVATMKEVDQQVGALTDRLKEQQANMTTDKESKASLTEAVVKTQETSVKAIEVIVEKYNTGEADITPAEVVEAVTSKLTTAETKVQAVTAKVEELVNPTIEPTVPATVGPVNATTVTESTTKTTDATQALTEAKDLLNQGDLTTALEKIVEGTTLVTEVELSIDTQQAVDPSAAEGDSTPAPVEETTTPGTTPETPATTDTPTETTTTN